MNKTMNKVMNRSMNRQHFEPWTIADLIRRDIARASGRQAGTVNSPTAATDWAPATDIVEKQDRFELRADLPGVSADEIEVSMDAGVLTISGERHAEERDEDDSVQRIERSSGRFVRRFSMPDTADAEGIKARTSNGILEVSIPKQPEPKAHRIAVEAA
jgi:HSP20 family protein